MTSATLSIGGRVRAAVAFTVLAACTTLGVVGSAHAASDDVPSLTVRYSDLNIATEQGSQALFSRIVVAAGVVCGPDDIRDLHAIADAKICRAQANARAVRDVNSPMLAAVYAARLQHG